MPIFGAAYAYATPNKGTKFYADLVQACQGKSVVRCTDHPAMTIAVDFGRKATKQTHKI